MEINLTLLHTIEIVTTSINPILPKSKQRCPVSNNLEQDTMSLPALLFVLSSLQKNLMTIIYLQRGDDLKSVVLSSL